MNEIERFINDHKNPVMKMQLPGKKMFFKSSTVEELNLIENCQTNLYNILSYSRVDKRCARAQAEWLPDKGIVKVTKVTKGLLQNFGHQDKNSIFLYPEEGLYLLETNRLEIRLDGKSMTIQDGYQFFISTLKHKLISYRIYKKLVCNGLRLVRYTEIEKKKEKIKHKSRLKGEESLTEKRKIEEENIVTSKRHCDELSSNQKDVSPQQDMIQMIFASMQKNSPQIYNKLDEQKPDYCVFLGNNKNRINFDFNLIICEGSLIDKAIYKEDKPTLYGVCIRDNIAFYKLGNINLPLL